jgi:PIN domain nuclease of toxin-antitoxin system
VIVLDTHALVWAVSDERNLGRKTRRLIERMWRQSHVAVSAMTFWEVALLQARHRLDLPAPAEEWRSLLLADGLIELPVTGAIGVRAVELGGLPEDPADRLIVATALLHRAGLVTADERLLDWKHPLARHDARA